MDSSNVFCAKDGNELEFTMSAENNGKIIDYFKCPVCDTEVYFVVAEDED